MGLLTYDLFVTTLPRRKVTPLEGTCWRTMWRDEDSRARVRAFHDEVCERRQCMERTGRLTREEIHERVLAQIIERHELPEWFWSPTERFELAALTEMVAVESLVGPGG